MTHFSSHLTLTLAKLYALKITRSKSWPPGTLSLPTSRLKDPNPLKEWNLLSLPLVSHISHSNPSRRHAPRAVLVTTDKIRKVQPQGILRLRWTDLCYITIPGTIIASSDQALQDIERLRPCGLVSEDAGSLSLVDISSAVSQLHSASPSPT